MQFGYKGTAFFKQKQEKYIYFFVNKLQFW